MGRVVDERSGEVQGAPVKILTVDVDQHIKGDVGRSLEVRTPSATDCDVEVPMNKAIGLLLTRSPEGVWLASACSVVEPGPLVAAGGEPRGGPIKVVDRDRDPRARPRVGAPAPPQREAAEPAGRARAVDLDSGRAVRARRGRRGRPDGRGHRAGRRGVGSSGLTARRGAGRGRARDRGDGEESCEARREGRRRSGGGARTGVRRRRDRRGGPPHRGGRGGRRGEGGDLPTRGRRAPAGGDPRLEHVVDPDHVARRRDGTAGEGRSGCTSSTRCRCSRSSR